MSEPPYPGERPESARDYDLKWISEHIEREQREVSFLGEIREIVFGAQDGLISTLAVVATVAGATNDRTTILIAGLATGLAGVFSMAIGEYIGSKSQEEIFEERIKDETEEVTDRPAEAEAEVAFMFMDEGMPAPDAWEVASIIARNPRSLLTTMVAKELGLAVESPKGSVLRGAIFMGGAFALGAFVPLLPFLLSDGPSALWGAVLSSLVILFSIGVIKSRWTRRSWLASGLEIVGFAALAGGAGYWFGTVLPSLLGVPSTVG